MLVLSPVVAQGEGDYHPRSLCFASLWFVSLYPGRASRVPLNSLCIWDGEDVDLLPRSMRRAAVAAWVRMPAVGQELCAIWIFCSFFFLFFFPHKIFTAGKSHGWSSILGEQCSCQSTVLPYTWLLGEAGLFMSVISSLVTYLSCRLELLGLKWFSLYLFFPYGGNGELRSTALSGFLYHLLRRRKMV